MVVVLTVADTPEAGVEVQGLAAVTSAVEQDSVLVDQDSAVVRSMEEWAVSSNVTMQIGTATGTGGMPTSSAIGSLFLTTVSGSDWTGIILTTTTMRTTTQDYYGYDASTDPYSVSTVSAVQTDLAKQGYYRGVIDGVYGPQTRVAITRYQSKHGLQVTGSLTPATLESLGMGS